MVKGPNHQFHILTCSIALWDAFEMIVSCFGMQGEDNIEHTNANDMWFIYNMQDEDVIEQVSYVYTLISELVGHCVTYAYTSQYY